MSKNKLFIVAMMVLVALNLGLMWQLFRRPPHHGQSNRNIIIERLNFDESQVKTFDELVTAHQKAIRLSEEALREYKSELYAKALAQNDTAMSREIIAKITAMQTSMEWVHYNHFEDIRSLCRPEQLPAFNELTGELAGMFSGRNPAPKEPRP
jgi:hypothetical protein